MNARTICVLHLLLAVAITLLVGCAASSTNSVNSTNRSDAQADGLVGTWRSRVTFTSGAFASGAFANIHDVEFLYSFNRGADANGADVASGTMTESSNYDAFPPTPPAYGVWRRVGPREFEAKYLFFLNKPPVKFEEIASGAGWPPTGHGELREQITLSADGRSFTSVIRYELFDAADKPIEGGGEAKGRGQRVGF